jgi:hypothetical protein
MRWKPQPRFSGLDPRGWPSMGIARPSGLVAPRPQPTGSHICQQPRHDPHEGDARSKAVRTGRPIPMYKPAKPIRNLASTNVGWVTRKLLVQPSLAPFETSFCAQWRPPTRRWIPQMNVSSWFAAGGDSGLQVVWEDGERVFCRGESTSRVIGPRCWLCCPWRSIRHPPPSIALLANRD